MLKPDILIEMQITETKGWNRLLCSLEAWMNSNLYDK